jgi:hypothetical protein
MHDIRSTRIVIFTVLLFAIPSVALAVTRSEPDAHAAATSIIRVLRPGGGEVARAAGRRLDRAAIVACARRYWHSTNPKYGRVTSYVLRQEEDGTNFASQAIAAGGWPQSGSDVNSDNAWFWAGGPQWWGGYNARRTWINCR